MWVEKCDSSSNIIYSEKDHTDEEKEEKGLLRREREEKQKQLDRKPGAKMFMMHIYESIYKNQNL